MDIRKLQRAIVDGLEDVKAQGIMVFDTEHLSPLFERVVIASGVSNRQTKALAASVRDAVKSQGFPVLRTEGEDNGEWIIVDCGAAVVHVMQPAIRDYYHLEEIWGEKQVKLKMDTVPKGLVKASEDAAAKRPAEAKKASAAKPGAKAPTKTPTKAPAKSAGKTAAKTAAKKAPAAKPATRTAPPKAAPAKAPARKVAAKKAPVAAKKVPARKPAGAVTRTVGVKKRAATTTAKRAPAKAPAKTTAKKAPAKKAPARKTSGR
jgi:ribosome-associated protein